MCICGSPVFHIRRPSLPEPGPRRAVLLGIERALARRTDRFIAVSAAQKREIVSAAIAPPERVAVIHNGVDVERYAPRDDAGATRGAMRRALDSGDLGAPLLLHCRHRNAASTPAFTSDMLLTSSATHEIDIVRWLLREEIVAVSVRTGRASRRAPAGVVDPRLLLLRTASGVLVDVEVFVNAGYGYDVRCELVGERGVHRLSPAPVSRDWRDRFAVAYRDQLRAWVGGLRRGAPDGPTAWDGYAATSVALAAVRSARSGREEAVTMADAVTPG